MDYFSSDNGKWGIFNNFYEIIREIRAIRC